VCVVHHGSVVQFKGQWYVLYHTSELSKGNAFRRSVCMDELTFDANGRINTVTATKNGPAPVSENTGARSGAPAATGAGSKQPIARESKRIFAPIQ
jgi:type II secretory pathway component PulC